MPTPEPAPFTARDLGNLVLARLAEIEYLRSPQREKDLAYEARANGSPYLTRDIKQADAKRSADLAQNLALYAQLAEVAAQAEHNDVLAAQQAQTRSRRAVDDY